MWEYSIAMHLPPSGVQSSLYVCLFVSLYLCFSISLSIHLSVSLSGCLHWFLAIIYAVRNFAQRMRPQVTGSNTFICIIICRSVCPVIHGPFAILVFVLISSVAVQRCDAFIPALGFIGPQWGPFKLMCPSVCPYIRLYVSLSLCLVVRIALWQS